MVKYRGRSSGFSDSGPRWSTRVVGLIGTILLHAFYLQAVTLGASAAKSRRPPEEVGPGASAILSSTGSWMTLVMVQLPGISHSEMLEDVASRGIAPDNAAIQVVSPDPARAIEVQQDIADVNAKAAMTTGDPAMQSLLFGRYTGQINARIDRAWRRPRSAVNADDATQAAASGAATSTSSSTDPFRCQARILQDADGNVKEIELISCNGTQAWQQSLIDAIQMASPLPAPPSPTVFTNALTLTFESRPEGDDEPMIAGNQKLY